MKDKEWEKEKEKLNIANSSIPEHKWREAHEMKTAMFDRWRKRDKKKKQYEWIEVIVKLIVIIIGIVVIVGSIPQFINDIKYLIN